MRSYLVTGGSGFIGAPLVRRLLAAGNRVRVFDNHSRGKASRLADAQGDLEHLEGDVRDAAAVESAVQGMDAVVHLAFVNGTEFFYTRPELVLEVGVKGIVNVLDACRKHHTPEFILASSSEVYQTPPVVPTDETVPLVVPDLWNPRYSYGAAKIISEVMAVHYGRTGFKRVVIFRPHNVYGPDMGWEHVIPQLVLRMKRLCEGSSGVVRLPVQGTGRETRAFIYIDDFTEGLLRVIEKGEHLGVYHIGTDEEVTIRRVAGLIGEYFKRSVDVVPGAGDGHTARGGTPRRCPDIKRLSALGWKSAVPLHKGVHLTAEWYDRHAELAPVVEGERV